jgi:hypothetical protein
MYVLYTVSVPQQWIFQAGTACSVDSVSSCKGRKENINDESTRTVRQVAIGKKQLCRVGPIQLMQALDVIRTICIAHFL